MQSHFRQAWRDLRRERPGQRFQARYERSRKNRHRSFATRIALIIAALVCFAIAVVLTVMPGPAILFFLLGGGLLANESRFVARLMDNGEVILRRVIRWGKNRWARLPGTGRTLLVGIAVGCSVAVGYLAYRFIRG